MNSEQDATSEATVKYVMFFHMDENAFLALPPDAQNKVHEACGAWHAELMRDGKTKGAAGLQPSSKSTTIRKKEGKPVIMDGPFAEAKEVIGGFEMIECKNHAEAVEIASRFPGLHAGISVEMRPLVPGNGCRA